MLLDGKNFRKISERDNYAFDASFSIDNSTGVGLFGFSGNGQQFKFDFQSGKIIDPESKYVSSYTPNEVFTLSGDINKGFYDYYINEIPVRLSGEKVDFKAQRFFTDSTGCSLDMGIVMTASGLDGIAITGVPDNFTEGDLITGKIVNTGSGASIDIYTGQLSDPSFTGNFSIVSLPTTISGDGDIVLSGVSGDNGVQYNLDFNFETSFGQAFASTQISGFGYYKWEEFGLSKTSVASFQTLPSGTGIISGGNYYAQKTGSFLGTVISGSGKYFLPGSTSYTSLEYVSGTTGNFSGMITGVNISSGGSGYVNDPILRITGGGGSDARVSGLLSGGIVTGFKIIDAGQGYTSVPSLVADNAVALIGVTNQGTGYLTTPEITLVGGGGSGANFFGVVEDGFLTEINVTNQGSGYTGVPEVHITAGNVSGLSVLSSGSNYSTGAVIFEGGTGASHISASADPLFAFKVTGIDVVSGGMGFNYPESNYQFTGGSPLSESDLASGEARFNWQVTGVDLTSVGMINVGGVKYTNIEVNFAGGTGSNGVTASGIPVIKEVLTGYSPIDAGADYKLARLSSYETPGVVISGSGVGENASGYAMLTGYKVSGLEIYYSGNFVDGSGSEPKFIEFAGGTGHGGIAASGDILTGHQLTNDLAQVHYGVTGVDITYGGLNYTGFPDINFRVAAGAGLTVNPPSGSGVLISGAISGVNFTSSGSGYSEGLPVSFTGGMPSRSGSGTVLTDYPYASITGLAGVRMISGGSGYTGIPTVTFGYSAASDGRISSVPTGSGVLGSGFITGVNIYKYGGFYQGAPQFDVIPSGTYGTPSYKNNLYVCDTFIHPEFSVLTGSGVVTGFTLTSGGSGYTGAPTVTVSGDGINASGLAKMATGALAVVTMAEGIVGAPIIGNYNKTFENTFNLFSGSGNAESGILYYDFSGNGAINAAKTKYSSDIVTFTGDQSVIDVKVSNNNYFDDSFMVAQLTWSGNGASTGITITGVR
jgi:hypothetical protein